MIDMPKMSLEKGVVIRDKLTTELNIEVTYSIFFMINLQFVKKISFSKQYFSAHL
jgi:hypothetical protein